jgi:hypothetical protein
MLKEHGLARPRRTNQDARQILLDAYHDRFNLWKTVDWVMSREWKALDNNISRHIGESYLVRRGAHIVEEMAKRNRASKYLGKYLVNFMAVSCGPKTLSEDQVQEIRRAGGC